MPIRAIFATGQTEITVNGLHQWDYGQKLEIYSSDIPTVVEVHFACAGMEEAIKRTCETSTGKATVTIPDRCLEQTTPIIAWVFAIDGTTGTTLKKITLTIEARTRPSVGEDIPADFSNQYTELISAVNGAVDALKDGSVVVAKAAEATKATKATQDGNGKVISDTYASKDLETWKAKVDAGTTPVGKATTAGKLSINYNSAVITGSKISVSNIELGKTYLVGIQPQSGYPFYTCVLFVHSGIFSSLSTLSALNYRCRLDRDTLSDTCTTGKITFMDADSAEFTPYAVYIREL